MVQHLACMLVLQDEHGKPELFLFTLQVFLFGTNAHISEQSWNGKTEKKLF